ncbi:MAG: prolyl-tRNA synthetase [Candidatus Berkelbacteria bacterium Licking1014_2]|uniref:Proline--tRNA ligase n=1 Tax=Candidatus Berkelbacteria bacterium Licking1014_2 TaxID=2017146 RepID=A0A554LXB2_9BACT|nr:MAG: prolyl-tRNA synthetase [Candidatus Berkelbacteria bacterium Licking1014_2]
MKFSQSFLKTTKERPKDADNISSELLSRGQFIDKLASGVYTILPLGLQVEKKIEDIIRQEMDALGGQELLLPVLQPKELWEKTNRWTEIDPPLFKLKDRHNRELALGSTHEEVITDLVQRRLNSYADLPLMLYQIQVKFRNEMRSSGGLLRVREFVMKDAYSFHRDKKDLDEFYQKMVGAYHRIFQKCGLETVAVEASSGAIGGDESQEFILLAETGEDRVAICQNNDFAANMEMMGGKEKCPKCGGRLTIKNGIENGHIFKLGDKYAKPFNLVYTDKDGKEKLVEMGCYGIGIGRLMATIVEASHDDKGIIWPVGVAPFAVHLLEIKQKVIANKIYQKLVDAGLEVLYDDRGVSPGEKLVDADLLGCPWRLVVSEKTSGEEMVEVKKRLVKETEIVNINEFINRFKNLSS